jgi:glycerol-3-phosphate dehydrogenase (NAD(P)+)
MAQGLGLGDNTRALVIARSLAELTRLGVALGGQPATFAGLAGMGDLVATCISPYGRNRHVGEQLALGKTVDEITAEMNMVAEGIKSSRVARELAEEHGLKEADHPRGVRRLPRGADPAGGLRGLLKTVPTTDLAAG